MSNDEILERLKRINLDVFCLINDICVAEEERKKAFKIVYCSEWSEDQQKAADQERRKAERQRKSKKSTH